jgi:hypothetical protein
MMNKVLISALLTLFFLSSSLQAKEIPSGGEIMIDALIARPLGLASVGLGLGLFVVSSPFSLLSGTFTQSGKRLVLYPLKFTFVRGLGDFPGYMEEMELVQD